MPVANSVRNPRPAISAIQRIFFLDASRKVTPAMVQMPWMPIKVLHRNRQFEQSALPERAVVVLLHTPRLHAQPGTERSREAGGSMPQITSYVRPRRRWKAPGIPERRWSQ